MLLFASWVSLKYLLVATAVIGLIKGFSPFFPQTASKMTTSAMPVDTKTDINLTNTCFLFEGVVKRYFCRLMTEIQLPTAISD